MNGAGSSVIETFAKMLDGQHDGVEPDVPGPTQYARGLNTSTRRGKLRTRPLFKAIREWPGIAKPFQGAHVYRLNSADRIVFCSAGKVYTYNLSTDVFKHVYTFPTAEFTRAYFVQADKYFLVQNGVTEPENWPLILDGDNIVDNASVVVYSDIAEHTGYKMISELPNPESLRVPIGTVMAYLHNRIHIAVDRIWDTGKVSGSVGWITGLGRRFWVSGDILKPDSAQEILGFLENTYLSEGGAFSLPAEMGFIGAMDGFRNANTGSGLGSLVVAARDGVAAYSVNAPRSDWKNVDLGQVLFTRVGTESPAAFLPINDDLIFRSATDGIRAVRYTISKEAGSSGSLSSVPLSQEIPDPFSRDTRESLPHVSAAWADNRLLMTSVSQVKEGETSFRTLVSMDTNVVGSLRGSTAPIFDGVWTGKNFLQVLRARKDAVDEAFILAREGSGGISLLQFSSTGPETPQCWVKTTQRDFGAITILKRLTAIHLWISGLVGTVVLDVYYRPDSYSKWAKCASSTITAAPGRTQVRGPLIFTPNVETINPQSGVPLHTGYSFQFCLAWKGVLVVERMLVLAAELPDVQRPAGCVETEDDQAATGLDLDEYTVYEV